MAYDQQKEIADIVKNQQPLELMTLPATAQYLGVSYQTLWRYRRKYIDFPKPIYSGFGLKIARSELDSWLRLHVEKGDISLRTKLSLHLLDPQYDR